MTETASSDTATARAGSHHRPQQSGPPEATGWVEWILFATIMMVFTGGYQALAGIVALFNEDYFAVNDSQLLVEPSYDAWGWVHLALGTAIVITAIGLLSGQRWARPLTVGFVMISAIVNIAFLSASPFWVAIMIGLDILVLWAVCVHGDEL